MNGIAAGTKSRRNSPRPIHVPSLAVGKSKKQHMLKIHSRSHRFLIEKLLRSKNRDSGGRRVCALVTTVDTFLSRNQLMNFTFPIIKLSEFKNKQITVA